MRLILSTRYPRNSAYSTEDGQILYKVNKPHKMGSSVATIRKAVHTLNGVWYASGNDSPPHPQAEVMSPISGNELDELRVSSDAGHRSTISRDEGFKSSASENDHAREGHNETLRATPALEGHFAFYAQIEFHTFESTRFQYDGLDIPANKYFRKEGWSWYGRNRIFGASDGKEYRWELRAGHLKMFTHDGAGTEVAKFREWHPHLGPLLKGHPPTLEIDPRCESILDEVIMTFVYCHKLRKDRERDQTFAKCYGRIERGIRAVQSSEEGPASRS